MAYSAALNTVYNHYLQTYSRLRPSRHDTHKQGELRGIYDSIVEQNRRSPLFLLDDSRQSHEFAVGLKENARRLGNDIAALSGPDSTDILSKKAAFSSDPAIVDVSFIGDENDGLPEGFEIQVGRLATGQQNSGHMLPADERPDLPTGLYSFDLAIGGTNYEFQFNINEGENNLDILNRLARLFDNAGLGLTAAVVSDDAGRAGLRLTADSTGLIAGREHQFVVSDDQTSRTAGAVAYLGLDNVTQEAADAEFLLNGVPRNAHSNHFTVEKVFELTLGGVSDPDAPPVRIGMKGDVESISDNIGQLMDSYNSFMQSVDEMGGGHLRGRQVAAEMQNIAALYQEDMAAMGLTLSEEGRLTGADSGRLWEALERGEGKALTSFTNAVMQKSKRIALNPMEYVDKKIVAYKNPARSFVNPYMTSAYSGMMFNSYC